MTEREVSLRSLKDSGPKNPALMRKRALSIARAAGGGREKPMRKMEKAARDRRFLPQPVSGASSLRHEMEAGNTRTRQFCRPARLY